MFGYELEHLLLNCLPSEVFIILCRKEELSSLMCLLPYFESIIYVIFNPYDDEPCVGHWTALVKMRFEDPLIYIDSLASNFVRVYGNLLASVTVLNIPHVIQGSSGICGWYLVFFCRFLFTELFSYSRWQLFLNQFDRHRLELNDLLLIQYLDGAIFCS